MNKSIKLKLTKPLLESISPKEIIYAEVARSGAMGNTGGIILYLIKDEQLLCCETDLFEDEETYYLAKKMFLNHAESSENKTIKGGEILFNHFYGGVGNNVFVNKNLTLEIKQNYFLYKKNNIEYQILSSVPGVFMGVAHRMKNPKDDK